MRPTFLGLEVSKRSIQMAQKALDITGNNMGNAGVKGFTRQRIDTSSLYISSYTYWQTRLSKLSLAGQGVTAFGVSQIRNGYLDKRYRDMAPEAAEHDTKVKILKEIETSLDNIDNFGLLAAFDKLKSTMAQVSLVSPDAKDMCSLVRNEAVNICSMLRSYNTDLERLIEHNLVELKNSINSANVLIEKIVEYNKTIVDEYASTDIHRMRSGKGVSEYGPLELLDQRNLLLDELAKYGNIYVSENVDGSVKVTMGGTTIIDGKFSENIVMLKYEDYNAAVLTFSNGAEFRPASGEIKAYVDMLNGQGPYSVGRFQSSEYGIPYYRNALNAFAEQFANLMNDTNGVTRRYDTYTPDMAALVDGEEYSIDITLSGVTRSITFLAGADADESIINMRDAINAGFGSRIAVDDTGAIIANPDSATISVAVTAGHVNAAGLNVVRDTVTAVDETRRLITAIDTTYGITAANIRVSDNWMDNSLMIGETYNQITGRWQVNNLDGTNLHRFVQALENPREWGRARDFTGTVFEYLMFLSNRMGQSIDFMENQFDVVMDTINTLLDNRDAISAVSDTEEGINMMTYQKWYNASARIMTTLDEALDVVINRMGRVGL
ncbi:MAG: hypothetical protein FWD34_07920 [Oscillospiraceae bacterium]|nr:hypothetical protein [Oscillospiraceae bacterium]